MSVTKNSIKLLDKTKTDLQCAEKNDEEETVPGTDTESCTYAVTVSKKPSVSTGEANAPAQSMLSQSFISIHSTDQLCQIAELDSCADLEECNLEVLSLNEVFPSTSEESVSNDDDSPAQKKAKNPKKGTMATPESAGKCAYAPMNSKSSTGPRRRDLDGSSMFSDHDIAQSTLRVVGSNPGEPKMSYQDPPKKITKSMKKFFRNLDKHKNEENGKSGGEKVLSKLTTIRSILKEGRCGLECTGDSVQGDELTVDDLTLPFPMDFSHHTNYTKGPDKSVSFNSQVVIIHFTGDLCVGQSVETLSKEKDQQARNSELRKTFLSKYNEFWPSQK